MDQAIDLRALDELDRKVDSLVREGRWTREAFATLWPQAQAAAAGKRALLGFIRLPADPAWLAADSEYKGQGFQRVPRRVTEVLEWLRDGWQPRFALPPVESVEWDGSFFPSRDVSLALYEDRVRIRGVCDTGSQARLDEEMHETPGRIVQQSIRTSHRGNWVVDISSVSLRRLSHQDGQDTFEFAGSTWLALLGSTVPDLWVGKILRSVDIHFGNLLLDRVHVTGEPPARWLASGSWGHLHVKGAYHYYFIESENKEQKSWFLVVDTEGRKIDASTLHRDRAALELVLGMRLPLSPIHGLLGADVVAAGRLVTSRVDDSGRAEPAISAERSADGERHISRFVEALSDAMRPDESVDVWVAIEAYLSSLQGTIDEQARKLYHGILALSFWIVNDPGKAAVLVDQSAWSAWLQEHGLQIEKLTQDPDSLAALLTNMNASIERNPWQVFDQAIQKMGIDLPATLRIHHAEHWLRLSRFGVLTTHPIRDPVELKRELDLIRELRSILIALIAARVGYRGPIRGTDYSGKPPPWWTVVDGDRPPQFAAVTAPHLLAPPHDADGITLFVEDDDSAVVVRQMLVAAGLPLRRILIHIARGRSALARVAANLKGPGYAVLAATNVRSLPDALARLRSELSATEDVRIFCSAPSTEAWALADDDLLRRAAGENQSLRALVDSLPLPEEVSDAFATVHRILGPRQDWAVLEKANVYRASARSPSLRNFLSGMSEMLGIKVDLPKDSVAQALDRDAIAGLIREMMPGTATAWQTSDGHRFTAEQISREIEQGTETGRQYAGELIRVAIDLLRRQARPRKLA